MTSSRSSAAKESARELERLKQGCIIPMCQRQEPFMQGARFSKNGFATIGDTDWQGVDPLQMREKIRSVDIGVLKKDGVFFFGLAIATSLPFAIPFP